MTAYKRVYLDTAPVIYILDRVEPYRVAAMEVIRECLLSGARFFTSTVTNMEYLVLPLRERSSVKIAAFETFKRLLGVDVIPIDDAVSFGAARIRADYPSIKGMDALQIAASVSASCDAFITNDRRLSCVSEINPVFLDRQR